MTGPVYITGTGLRAVRHDDGSVGVIVSADPAASRRPTSRSGSGPRRSSERSGSPARSRRKTSPRTGRHCREERRGPQGQDDQTAEIHRDEGIVKANQQAQVKVVITEGDANV